MYIILYITSLSYVYQVKEGDTHSNAPLAIKYFLYLKRHFYLESELICYLYSGTNDKTPTMSFGTSELSLKIRKVFQTSALSILNVDTISIT